MRHILLFLVFLSAQVRADERATFSDSFLLNTGDLVLQLPVPAQYRVNRGCFAILPVDLTTLQFRDAADVSVTIELSSGKDRVTKGPGETIRNLPITMLWLGKRPIKCPLFVKKLGVTSEGKVVTTNVAELHLGKEVLQETLGSQIDFDLTIQVSSDDKAVVEDYVSKNLCRLSFRRILSIQETTSNKEPKATGKPAP